MRPEFKRFWCPSNPTGYDQVLLIGCTHAVNNVNGMRITRSQTLTVTQSADIAVLGKTYNFAHMIVLAILPYIAMDRC